MNESARQVLKNNKQTIKDNLILERDILDELEQNDTLTEDQVHTIWAETTNANKISQLLFTLPRRGPEAFTNFLKAIRKNSRWLAENLEKALNTELEKDVLEDLITNSDNINPPANDTQYEDEKMHSPSDQSYVSGKVDDPIKIFRFSEVTMANQIPQTSFNVMVQQNLSSLYAKLKLHLTCNYMREPSFSSPGPITFEMIHQLLDEMLQNLDQSYSLLGAKDRSASLQTLILVVKKKNSDLKAELKKKDEQRNKYANNNMKLENQCREAQSKVNQREKDIKILTQEKLALQTEVEQISKENNEAAEKLRVLSETYDSQKEDNKESIAKLEEKIEYLETQCKQYQYENKLKTHPMTYQNRDGFNTGKYVVCSKCNKTFSLKTSSENTNNDYLSSAKERKLLFKNPSPDVTPNLNVPDESPAQNTELPHVSTHSSYYREAKQTRLQTGRQNCERDSHNDKIYNSSTNLHMQHNNKIYTQHGARQNALPNHPSRQVTRQYASVMMKREQRFPPNPFVNNNMRYRNGARPGLQHTGLVTKSLDSLHYVGNMMNITARK